MTRSAGRRSVNGMDMTTFSGTLTTEQVETVSKMQRAYEDRIARQLEIINHQGQRIRKVRELVMDPLWNAELAGYSDFLTQIHKLVTDPFWEQSPKEVSSNGK